MEDIGQILGPLAKRLQANVNIPRREMTMEMILSGLSQSNQEDACRIYRKTRFNAQHDIASSQRDKTVLLVK